MSRRSSSADKLISETIDELDEIRVKIQQNNAFVCEDVVRLRMKLLSYFGQTTNTWVAKKEGQA